MKRTLCVVAIVAFLTGCNNEPDVNMLTNHGLTKRSWLHLNLDDGTSIAKASSMWESQLDGNVPNSNSFGWAAWNGEPTIKSADGSEPSAYFATQGYKNSQWGQYPGFDMWQYPSGPEAPVRLFIMNNALAQEQPYNLHKVGFAFNHFSPTESAGRWGFKSAFKLGDFKEVKPDFDAALENYVHAQPVKNEGAYLTANLRVVYMDDDTGKVIRKDILGVVFSVLDKSDFNGNANDEIYYQTDEKVAGETWKKKFLLADKLKLPYIANGNYSKNAAGPDAVKWTKITFDYKSLLEKYLPAPAGYDIDDAAIIGFDIFSVSKGADVGFWLKDVQLNGVN